MSDTVKARMLINYSPGDECRVAMVENGKLEELHVERFSAQSHVGSIYVGKVVNVEPAIQAAFVDFGLEENGFLHVSDLHPKYFPGEDDETTERVGFKTPRRERPPIQRALRRGDEVIVQVLKEGVGTKGPTVTSYLSIPGRFLVMMPGMDAIGVSRKVEDEDQRRQMREILDQLDLPEGFGFILRTAGMDRTKTELKRDLAYLQRLWKDMERRLKAGGKPRLLYNESDLLVRSLRDFLTSDIEEVVIDNENALRRAARFMKIVSPRGSTRLVHYPGKTPIFHAFGVERQIALINAREVPLASGGRLVIDQTEALVAIDVNSGKSRDSRNSEENAYQTNIEAVDEICRQLRLRDMGGIVINDLIDMRRTEHRRDIEQRFRDRLKRDRAKTTIAHISEFGILEMTRQRMRPSHESLHFTECDVPGARHGAEARLRRRRCDPRSVGAARLRPRAPGGAGGLAARRGRTAERQAHRAQPRRETARQAHRRARERDGAGRPRVVLCVRRAGRRRGPAEPARAARPQGPEGLGRPDARRGLGRRQQRCPADRGSARRAHRRRHPAPPHRDRRGRRR